jgi:hypothetical protein
MAAASNRQRWREACEEVPASGNVPRCRPENRCSQGIHDRRVLPRRQHFPGNGAYRRANSMVGSIGGFNSTSLAVTSALNRTTSAAQSSTPSGLSTKTSSSSATDVFMDYMKKSPAERMEDNWLKVHGLSKEKLAAMSPKDREAVMKQMKTDIENNLKQQTEAKATVDILA